MPSTIAGKVCAAASLFAVFAFSQTTPVVRLQNLAHTTESLDKTLPFYRDVLGLPMNGTRDPLAQQPQKLDEEMSKFTATKGMSFRGATFRIPNAAFGFELTEFTGRLAQARTAEHPGHRCGHAGFTGARYRKGSGESKGFGRAHRNYRGSPRQSHRESE